MKNALFHSNMHTDVTTLLLLFTQIQLVLYTNYGYMNYICGPVTEMARRCAHNNNNHTYHPSKFVLHSTHTEKLRNIHRSKYKIIGKHAQYACRSDVMTKRKRKKDRKEQQGRKSHFPYFLIRLPPKKKM